MKNPWVRLVVVLVAIAVVGTVGWFWYQEMQKPPEETDGQDVVLLDSVDRGIKPEDMLIQQQKIADLQAEIAAKTAAGERDTSLILRLGNLYYTIGELKLASEQYLDILSTHPNDVPALENLGQSQMERGDYSGAEQSWRAAVALSPFEITYMKLADLISDRFPERQDEVGPLLEEAIANLGQTPGLLSRLGEWYADQGMYDEAISHYQVALQLDPDNGGIIAEIDRLKTLRAGGE